MTSSQPGRPSRRSRTPAPTTRRQGQSSRPVARASTRSTMGNSTLLVAFTGIAIVGALVLIGFAWLTSSNKGTGNGAFPSPQAPGIVTPSGIPQDGRTLGNANAKVTLDLWSDFQCPNCGTFARTYEPELVDKYVKTGVMKLVYHHFTVVDELTGGTESQDAANASWCAQDQGKFWTFHDWLYANQYGEGKGGFSQDRLVTIGQLAGLDMSKYKPCVENRQHLNDVKAESSKTPVSGTPGIIVNGVKVDNGSDPQLVPTLAQVEAAIEKAAGTASQSPAPSASASASAS